MKKRYGFVSNSSSTSYIIAYKDKDLNASKLASILRENLNLGFDIFDILAFILLNANEKTYTNDEEDYHDYEIDYADLYKNGYTVRAGESDDKEFDIFMLIDIFFSYIEVNDEENGVFVDTEYCH